MNIKVSINILNYNTYEKSCVCIDSCLKQEGVNYQILLVDNASTDDSFSKLKERYGDRIVYLQTGKNFGFAGGNNKSIEYCLANGVKYALLLNSDTELKGSALLKELISIVEQNERCAVVSPTIYDVTKAGLLKHTNDYAYNRYLRMCGILPKNNKISDSLETVSEAHGSALLVDCECFKEVGGFPEHYFMYCEESTLAKKILWSQHEILWYKNDINHILHHHDKSKSTDSWREFLMGRNRSIEYHEAYKKHNWSWVIIYNLFKLKMYFLGMKTKNMNYYNGMKTGDIMCKSGYSFDECYQHGVDIRNSYIAKK